MSLPVPAERRRRQIRGSKHWWYVDRRACLFYADCGAVIRVPTSAIRRALAALDRDLAKEKRKP
jgi:hypothetical protein